MYQWDFSWVWAYRRELLEALLVTIELNLVVVVCGSLLGALLGLGSLSRRRWQRVSIRLFVDLVRALPTLVMLVWAFFCLPVMLGGVRITSFQAAALVLSLNLAAFVAEIVRAGIEAVPRDHVTSARALGMSRWQTARYVTLPIALRMMIPPLVGQVINTIKLSVLASVIGVPELLARSTDLISQVYRPLEFYTALALMFAAILLPITIWSRRLESRTTIQRTAETAA